MPLYRVTRKSDGAEVYRYNADAPVPWAGMEFDSHDHTVVAEPAAPAPAPTPRQITRLAFRLRFTQAEKTGIEIAALHNPALATNHPSNLAAASLRSDLADQRDATHIDLNRPETRAGVIKLEQYGLIGSGRALVILDAPIQPEEVYRA